MLTKNFKTIKSFLPVFNGFYCTVFEPNEDNEIEAPYCYDDYTFDYEDYKTRVAKACVSQIETKLTEFDIAGVKIQYDVISSPREYNFANDAIWVTYKLTNKGITAINSYLKKNSKAFTEYIKDRYTSRDGFSSWYSSDAEVWKDEYMKDTKQLEHVLGAILEFIFENEGYDSFDLYEDVCNDCYLYGTLNEGVREIDTVINEYIHTNYIDKDITTITSELVNHFEDNKTEYDFLTYDYVESRVIRVFNAVAKHTLTLFKVN